MSLRYAHLAPDQRREAVAKLNVKPLLAPCAYPALTAGIAILLRRSILIDFGGERGTRTLDLGIMSADAGR